MKVRAVTLNNGRYIINLDGNTRRNRSVLSERAELYDLAGIPFYTPISFGMQNSAKLRDLFGYGLPCMYSGIKMIDPRELMKYISVFAFNGPASDVLKIFAKYDKSITGMERKVLEILRDRAVINPNKNIQQLIQEVEPVYRRRLGKRQAPIFHEISEIFKELPQIQRSQFEKLMADTKKKLDEKPVTLHFSANEFKYKFFKIKEFIVNKPDKKARKAVNEIFKETKKFADKTTDQTIKKQRDVLANIEKLFNKSVLKDNEDLRELIETSKDRLAHKEIIVPFSRKSFIYDLDKIIKPLGDAKLEERVLKKASQLPTSSQSLSAYILKLADEKPEKIGYRILRPTTASVEHISPKSCGGENAMSNYGGACADINSARHHMPLDEWVIKHPEVKENCQKYVDRLIELYHKGVFFKLGISPKYIVDFKNTVETQSKNLVKLDISKM